MDKLQELLKFLMDTSLESPGRMVDQTVFIVCTQADGRHLYVFSDSGQAHKAADLYRQAYGTPCEVFEELLRK